MGRQWSSGTSRPGWNREAGPVPALAAQWKPTVNRPPRSRYASTEVHGRATEMLPADSVCVWPDDFAASQMAIFTFSGRWNCRTMDRGGVGEPLWAGWRTDPGGRQYVGVALRPVFTR